MSFEKNFDNELSQSSEDSPSDRDTSVLPLLGMEIREMRYKVHMAEKKETDAYGCDGRFDDPVNMCPSPATSASRGLPYTRQKPEVSAFKGRDVSIPVENIVEGIWGAHLGESLAFPDSPKHIQRQQNFLCGTQTDDDSNQSFHSCLGTPPRSKPVESNLELAIDPFPPNSRRAIQTTQSPHRMANHFLDPGTVQQTSHLRQSVPAISRKRPGLTKLPLKSGPGTPRGFHSSSRPRPSTKQQDDSEEPMQVSFGTATIGSAQSSFNASTSFSNKAEKYWSPPTSADTSFNEAEDVGVSRNSTTRLKGLVSARLCMVAEGIGEGGILRDPETLYHGDLESEVTDVDDPKISPITPLKRFSRRPSKTKPLVTQASKSRKHEDERAQTEAMFYQIAEGFFEGEPEPVSDLPISPRVEPTYNDHKTHMAIDGDGAARAEAVRGGAEGHLVDEWLRLNNLNTCYSVEIVTDEAEGEGKEEGEEEGKESSQEPSNNGNGGGGGGDGDGDDDGDDDDEFGTIDKNFLDELSKNPAFKPAVHPLRTLHFSVQYEATRVALNDGYRSNYSICMHLRGYCDELYEAKEYEDLWKTLTQFSKAAATLQRTSGSVWMGFKEASGWPDNVYLSGNVHWGEALQVHSSPAKVKQASVQGKNLEKVPLTVTLNHLKRIGGNRFFSRFGSDRFLTLRLPSFPGLPMDALLQRHEQITDWLVDGEIDLLNRTWKCIYITDHTSKKKSRSDKKMISENFNRAIFFATKGVGIGEGLSDRELEELGFRKDNRKLRQEMSLEELLEWHIPLKGNIAMLVSKFWSRISLGFSDATPTVTFQPSQIKYVKDFFSPTKNVMNDGCSVASPAVMKMVRQRLGYDMTPTAVQARLGGAKGIWMVDPEGDWNSDEIYIKVTDSQSKYTRHDNDEDWARLTLDVLAASHDPTPARLNTQLIPILEDRGVRFEILKELFEEHLEGDMEELFQVIDEPVELRRWMHHRGNLRKDRMMSKGVATLGALPATKEEIVILLLESGFLVRECQFLVTQVEKIINQYCDDLKSTLHIRNPHSTSLFCVADPTDTLEEGEVSLRFSNGILDLKTMRRITVITGDILVARNPAHLPSDIQKVKAVDIQSRHSPKLKELQDVIVFSVKGNRSLASLLSGGDYDGDKPWVCWDEKLVGPFQNSDETFDGYEDQARREFFEVSEEKIQDLKPDQPGFINRFMRRGILNSLQLNLLGFCTNAWDKVYYNKNRISDPQAIEMAMICSILVDAPKQGLSIYHSKKEEITRWSNQLPKPAYKDPQNYYPSNVNVIDRLCFEVVGPKVMEKQTVFHQDYGKTATHESVLTEIYHREENFATGEGSGKPLNRTLGHLRNELRRLKEAWEEWTRGRRDISSDEFRPGVQGFYREFKRINPPEELSKDPVIGHYFLSGDSHFSDWSLLRASAAYYMWNKSSTLVWYMAGRELCFIKSQEVGRKSEFGPRTMTEEMYVPLKTSANYRGIRKGG